MIRSGARPRLLAGAALCVALGAASCASSMDEARRNALLDDADRALVEGRLADAEETFARVQRAFPEDARAALGVGLARLRQGRAGDAVRSFDLAAKLQPSSADPAYLRAVALEASGRQSDAIDAFAMLVSSHPDHQRGTAGYVEALEKAGRADEARTAAVAAAERWPRQPDLAMRAAAASAKAGDSMAALRFYEQARQVRPFAPEPVAGIIQILNATGRGADARRLGPLEADLRQRQQEVDRLAREAARDPGNPDPARRLVQRLFEDGRLEQAVAQSDLFIRQFPADDFGGALAVRAAQASAHFGDAEAAHRFLEHATRGARTRDELVAAAEVHATLGEFEEAFAAYELLLLDHPSDPAVLLGLGRVAMRTDRLERAEPVLRRAVAMSPGSAPAQAALGLVLIKKEDSSGARAALEAALKIEPALADAQFGLGFLEHQQGRPAQAEPLLRGALRSDPAHATARTVLALALSEQGKCAEALPLFTRALEGDYRNLTLHMGLVRCYEDTGRLTEAEAARAIARELQGSAAR
jgi:tetratricopeptide (TPR) repeat protein